MIKEINLVGLMNNNLLLFIMMMCSVIFVSCTKLKNKQSFNVNLFDFNQLSYNELTDLGFKPSENTDFTSLYQYFGDTAKHEDTLVYYQFENNPKENSLPIYRHISVYMERQDYTFIGEYLDEENFEIISKIDTINDNYFFKTPLLLAKNAKLVGCVSHRLGRTDLFLCISLSSPCIPQYRIKSEQYTFPVLFRQFVDMDKPASLSQE